MTPQPLLFQAGTSWFGGAERFLHNLLRGLDRTKFRPLGFSMSPQARFSAMGDETIPLITAQAGTDAVDAVGQAIEAHDVRCVITSSYRPELGLAAKKCKIRHVWRVPSAPQVNLHGNADLVSATRALSALADAIVCPSQFIRNSLGELGINQTRLIRNGVAPEFLEAGAVRESRPEVKTVTAVGHLLPQKDHATFIEACALTGRQFPLLQFQIIGRPVREESADDYHRQLQTRIEQLGLTGRFSVNAWENFGPQPLFDSDIVVQCSIGEGFGNALAEAMALKIPVVAAQSGGYVELIQDNRNGMFFEPGNAADLARRLTLLIEDGALRKKLAEQAHCDMALHLDYRDCTRHYEQLFEELISRAD